MTSIKPMLAHEFEGKRADAVGYPCMVQPKLDGVRMVARLGDGALFSRNGNDFGHLSALFGADLRLIAKELSGRFLAIDGELYVHGAGFQAIVSMAKNTKSAPPLSLQYHVYDAIDADGVMPFEGRIRMLHNAFSNVDLTRIELVETTVARDRKAVEGLLRAAEAAGYEGIMVRAPSEPYKSGKRSAGLLKYKRFRTDEFVIVGVREATGKDAGTPVFECRTPSGAPFSARPVGTLQERRNMFKEASRLLGKWLTVQYQGLSDDGVPRFPVALAVRDYE